MGGSPTTKVVELVGGRGCRSVKGSVDGLIPSETGEWLPGFRHFLWCLGRDSAIRGERYLSYMLYRYHSMNKITMDRRNCKWQDHRGLKDGVGISGRHVLPAGLLSR
jgi:hypothetical protein